MCTARSSSGRSVRAYCIALADAAVQVVEQDQHRVAAQHRRGGGLERTLRQLLLLRLVLVVQPDEQVTRAPGPGS